MEKLSANKRGTIVRDYLSALPYGEIATKNHVSTGTVANVVADLKTGKFPEAPTGSEQIELLRELSLDLKQSNLTPGQCTIGIAILNRINECGLEPADIDRWPLILKSVGNADQVPGIHQTGLRDSGSHEENWHESRRAPRQCPRTGEKTAALEPMLKQYEDSKKQIAELTGQHNNLSVAVSQLKKEYELLNPRVKDLRERERELSSRVKDLETRAAKAEASIVTSNKEKKRLLEIGLSLEALSEFNDKVQSMAHRHHITTGDKR